MAVEFEQRLERIPNVGVIVDHKDRFAVAHDDREQWACPG
jgi:hypothetical protein